MYLRMRIVCLSILLSTLSTLLFSQATVRQGSSADLRLEHDQYNYTSPMILTQSLRTLCVDHDIDRDGIGRSFSFGKYRCDNVSLKQIYVERRNKKRWPSERLSIWVLVYTYPHRDKLVTLKLNVYLGEKWICGSIITDIDAEETKETESEVSFSYPKHLFTSGIAPVLKVTMIVHDNG